VSLSSVDKVQCVMECLNDLVSVVVADMLVILVGWRGWLRLCVKCMHTQWSQVWLEAGPPRLSRFAMN
jgi:hypothetical protein